MLDGERASRYCEDCGMILVNQVMRSAAGWYIGTACDCGPYSRESGYYNLVSDADFALQHNSYGR